MDIPTFLGEPDDQNGNLIDGSVLLLLPSSDLGAIFLFE